MTISPEEYDTVSRYVEFCVKEYSLSSFTQQNLYEIIESVHTAIYLRGKTFVNVFKQARLFTFLELKTRGMYIEMNFWQRDCAAPDITEWA